MNKIDKIKELTELLNKASDSYYNTGDTIMEDREYDSLLEELRSLEQETGFVMMASPTHKVGYEVKSELQKVTHNHPMLSLAKTKDWNEFIRYFGNKDVIGMEKMDGLTCSLRYIDGELVSAETRGNGEVGEDILHNIKTVKTVPQKIPYKDELIVDGEIICTYQDFEPFSTEYKNPRNFASGSIRLLDSNECAKRPLTFVAWNVIKGFDNENSFLRKLVLIDELGLLLFRGLVLLIGMRRNFWSIRLRSLDTQLMVWLDALVILSMGRALEQHHIIVMQLTHLSSVMKLMKRY